MSLPFVLDFHIDDAIAQFFPSLERRDVDIYTVDYTTSADWHSEIHEDTLWLPIDDEQRAKAVSLLFPESRFKMIAVEGPQA